MRGARAWLLQRSGNTMTKLLSAAAAIAVAASVSAPAWAGTSFVSSTAVSNASADTDAGQSNYGQGFATKRTTPTSFQPQVSATAGANAVSFANDGVTTDSANALEQSNGYFASAAAGTLDLAGITSASTYGAGETAEAYSEGQAVQYTFDVDTASTINLDYVLNESFTGCCSTAQIYLGSTNFSSQIYNKDLPLNTSGDLSFNLSPGVYLLDFSSQVGDDAYATAGSSSFGAHEEKLDFSISAAPEPGLWALLIAAIGLTGLTLRRRRRLDFGRA